jgi:hypothetical protein
MCEGTDRTFGLERKRATGRWKIINCALREILLSATALGITQPPVERVTGTSMSEVRRPGGFEANH